MSSVKGLLGTGLAVCVAMGLLVWRSAFLQRASVPRRPSKPAAVHVVRLGALTTGLLIILAVLAAGSFALRNVLSTPGSVAAKVYATQSSTPLTPLIILPSNKACVAGGKLTVQFNSTPHGPWAKATIYLNGKRLTTLRYPHIKRLETVTGLPQGNFIIAVTGVTRAGRARAINRRYKACAAKSEGKKQPKKKPNAKPKKHPNGKPKKNPNAKPKKRRNAKPKKKPNAKQKKQPNTKPKKKPERETKEKAEREAKEKAEREAERKRRKRKKSGSATAWALLRVREQRRS